MKDYEFSIPIIKELAKVYYDKKTYEHALRVAHFIKINSIIYEINKQVKNFRNYCYALAICHDLFEDTDIPQNIFDEDLNAGIEILTKAPDETYADYCKRISITHYDYHYSFPIDLAAWFVKIADMKDHLTQTATLTDKLKAKYLEGIGHLL